MPEYKFDIDLFIQEKGIAAPLLAELICKTFYPRLRRIASAIQLSSAESNKATRLALIQAIHSLDTYSPGSGFPHWFFTKTIQFLVSIRSDGDQSPKPTHLLHPNVKSGSMPTEQQDPARAVPKESILTSLPRMDRVLLILYFGEGFTLANCASIIGMNINRAHALLTSLRVRVTKGSSSNHISSKRTHPNWVKRINAHLDGFGEDENGFEDLDKHLESCHSCRLYTEGQKEAQQWLTESVNMLWPLPTLAEDDFQAFIQNLNSTASHPLNHTLTNIRRKREILWISTPLILAILLIILFNQREIAARPTPIPLQYRSSSNESQVDVYPTPTRINQPPQIVSASPLIRQIHRLSTTAVASSPVISSDGRWVAFSSPDLTTTKVNRPGTAQIYIYDTVIEEQSLVSVSSDGIAGDAASFSPSISDDGQWIVFASLARNLLEQAPVCEDEHILNCARIYLANRGKKSIQAITSTEVPGSASTGLYPVISGDGRWIAYWGKSPLSETAMAECEPRDILDNRLCWDIFIYDRDNNETSRLRVGKLAAPEDSQSLTLDISADGERLVFPIQATDPIAGKVSEIFPTLNDQDVFVYDRNEDVLVAINVTPEGNLGNGDSYAASLSSDGSTVAFASAANDIVQDDTNQTIDIFVRDLKSESTTRVSITNSGTELFSAATYAGVEPLWYHNIDLSGDGKQVAFVSNAPELSGNFQKWCSSISRGPVMCYRAYIHHRETGKTALALPPSATQIETLTPALVYNHPRLSYDGSISVWSTALRDCPWQPCQAVTITGSGDSRPIVLGEAFLNPKELIEDWLSKGSIKAHDGWLNDLAFSSRWPLLATGGRDGAIHLWTSSQTLLTETNAKNLFPNLGSYSSDHLESVLPWTPEDIVLWKTLNLSGLSVTSLAFSPSGDALAASYSNGPLIIWDIGNGRIIQRLGGNPPRKTAITFSPVADMMAAASKKGVTLYELSPSGFFSEIVTLPPYDEPLTALSFSPDGKWIAAAGMKNGNVWLQPISKQRNPILLEGHDDQVLDVSFSPSGNWLASASKDGSINIWNLNLDLAESEIKHNLTLWHKDWVKTIAWGPDGTTLAAGTFASTVYLWDIPSGELIQEIHRSRQDQVMAIAFSFNGDTLAFGGAQGWLRIAQPGYIPEKIENPIYFRRASGPVISELASPRNAAEGQKQSSQIHFYSSVQEAALITTYPLMEFHDLGGDFTQNTVFSIISPETDQPLFIYYYTQTNNFQPAIVSLYQGLLNPREITPPIGANAQVDTIDLPHFSVEVVQGQWLYFEPELSPLVTTRYLNYRWEMGSATTRIRWQKRGVYYSLEYVLPFDQEIVDQETRLSAAELLDLARSLRPVSPSP